MSKKKNLKSLQNSDYDIGYQRPPKLRQFQPGQSGNPKGRPKGSQNFITAINHELNSVVTVTENGIHKKIQKKQVVAKQLVNKAAAGDLKATTILLSESRMAEQNESARFVKGTVPFMAEDKLVLASILKRLRETPQNQPPTPEASESTAESQDGE
jgi:hypothetical protein